MRFIGFVRRYRVLLAIGTAWLATVVVLPSVQAPRAEILAGRGALPGVSSGEGVSGVTSLEEGVAPTATVASAPAAGAQRTAATAAGNAAACRALTGPIPSVYFPACVPEWRGDNGGATAPGVTATTIRLADYWAPRETGDNYIKARSVFLAYFNKVFQLYGRHVEIVDFHADNDPENHEGACTDAATAQSRINPFAIAESPPQVASCAAERGIMSFASSDEHPESFFARYHPYIWGHVMACERMGYQLGEYLGKRVASRPARWAGDAELNGRLRRLALYVPEDAVYGPCIRIAERSLEHDYGAKFASVFRYGPSKERLADQAARAILQFKTDGATSVVLAADTLSIELLTDAATASDFHPEWITSGVAASTWDMRARNYDQSQVNGHMFGRAVNAEERLVFGPEGEPNRLYRQLTGHNLPSGTGGFFYGWLEVFTRLQAAGPRLDAAAVARGAFTASPIGVATDPNGVLSYRTTVDGRPGVDHTREDSAREVYWDGDRVGYDGKRGTFVSTYNGRFFNSGEWPAGEPPVYPGR